MTHPYDSGLEPMQKKHPIYIYQSISRETFSKRKSIDQERFLQRETKGRHVQRNPYMFRDPKTREDSRLPPHHNTCSQHLKPPHSDTLRDTETAGNTSRQVTKQTLYICINLICINQQILELHRTAKHATLPLQFNFRLPAGRFESHTWHPHASCKLA